MSAQTSEPLRAGLVGCGRIGTRSADARLPTGWIPLAHAEAIRSLPELVLVAVCDVDGERLAEAGERLGVEHRYADYRELILRARPDVLAVATRTPGRCDIVEFAATHGVRGIHAEKPLARSMAECERALAAVARHDVRLSYGTTRRFMDAYRSARELATSGELGDVLEVTLEHGRASLLWSHPHSADLLLFLSGSLDVEWVQATCTLTEALVGGLVLDDDPLVEHALVRFVDGVTGVVTRTPGMNVSVAGTRGTVTVGANGTWVELRTSNDPASPYRLEYKRLHVAPTLSGTQRALRELAAAVSTDSPLSITLDEIAVGQRMLLAWAFSALEGGARVRLEDVPKDFFVSGRTGLLYA